MKVTEHLEQASEPLISYEIIPPKRGGSIEQMLDVVGELMPYDPPFIDVTSHAAEVAYEKTEDGRWQRKIKRKRPGTIELCASIEDRFGIDTVPHLLCRGFTKAETQEALLELEERGIDNVLAIQGDETNYEKQPENGRPQNKYAADLVEQIDDLNQGVYLDGQTKDESTDFCVGVGGYPEGHFEAPNLSWDIMRLKQKVEAGADYVVTQMYFDNDYFFHFVEKCRDVGIEVPIIPGIKILKRKSHLRMLPKYFHTEIPEELTAEVDAADPDDVEDIGVEWAIQQCEELIEAGVPCIHFYIMTSADTVTRVVEPLQKKMA